MSSMMVLCRNVNVLGTALRHGCLWLLDLLRSCRMADRQEQTWREALAERVTGRPMRARSASGRALASDIFR